MKKTATTVFAIGTLVSVVVASYLTNADQPTVLGFGQWLMSLGRRTLQKVLAVQGWREKAASLIADQEGFVDHYYLDAAGKGTIGYGHLVVDGDGFGPGSTITEPEAWDLLQRDMQTAIDCVTIQVSVSLNDNQMAALVSLAYNIGCGNFSSSTLVRLLNAGNYDGAAAEFGRWVFAGKTQLPGLVARREVEAELFQS